MPSITCPYCKVTNPSKFAHKLHLRTVHTSLFENNIKTSITGASSEISYVSHDIDVDDPRSVRYDDGSFVIVLRVGFDQYNLRINADMLLDLVSGPAHGELVELTTLANDSVDDSATGADDPAELPSSTTGDDMDCDVYEDPVWEGPPGGDSLSQ